MIRKVVVRYGFVERNPQLLKRRLLSEQDISTKFVLPMLEALNWDPLKITVDGPQIHEKGFREKDIKGSVHERARRGGLPDYSLNGPYSTVPFFVEVKHPNLSLSPQKHLAKYRDSHLVFLTSFKKSQLVRIGKGEKKETCAKFLARSPEFYVDKFDNLWKHVSNSREAEDTRRAIKAWRHGQRGDIRK